MNDQVARYLATGHTIDMTTTGRRTGRPRRIEITFHNIDGRLIISGSPRRQKRAWIYNLEADPHLTLHLRGSVKADVQGSARVITDERERRVIADWIVANAWRGQDPAAMTELSPMIEVTLD